MKFGSVRLLKHWKSRLMSNESRVGAEPVLSLSKYALARSAERRSVMYFLLHATKSDLDLAPK
jgi:hypothetical protein